MKLDFGPWIKELVRPYGPEVGVGLYSCDHQPIAVSHLMFKLDESEVREIKGMHEANDFEHHIEIAGQSHWLVNMSTNLVFGHDLDSHCRIMCRKTNKTFVICVFLGQVHPATAKGIVEEIAKELYSFDY